MHKKIQDPENWNDLLKFSQLIISARMKLKPCFFHLLALNTFQNVSESVNCAKYEFMSSAIEKYIFR